MRLCRFVQSNSEVRRSVGVVREDLCDTCLRGCWVCRSVWSRSGISSDTRRAVCAKLDSGRARFQDFAARKTADASRASLDAFVTDTDHAASDGLDSVGNAWTRRLFDGGFYLSPAPDDHCPACSLVFVQSREGNTGTDNPFSLGGGESDKHLIYEGLSQVAVDAVLSGASTVRGSEIVFGVWHPELVRLRAALGKPRYPIQIVATLGALDFDTCLLFNVPEIEVLVLTVERGVQLMRKGLASRPWVQPLVMSRPEDLSGAFAALRARGIARVSAVGGRHLATQLIDQCLVQDVLLTTSPRSGGEPDTPFYPGPLTTRALVRKHGTGADAGVVFEQLRLEALTASRPGPARA